MNIIKALYLMIMICGLMFSAIMNSQNNLSGNIIDDKEFIFNNIVLPDSLRSLKIEEEFFLKNGMRENVITEKNGLQILIIKDSNSVNYRAHDETFLMEYTGYFTNGTIFDSSQKQGGIVQFGFNDVVRGLAIGVKKVPKYSRFVLYIPSRLGYGKKGIKGAVPANSPLIFDIELY